MITEQTQKYRDAIREPLPRCDRGHPQNQQCKQCDELLIARFERDRHFTQEIYFLERSAEPDFKFWFL